MRGRDCSWKTQRGSPPRVRHTRLYLLSRAGREVQRDSLAVLFVAGVLHPIYDLAIKTFLDGDMRHRRRRRRVVAHRQSRMRARSSAIDWSERLAGLIPLALIAPEPPRHALHGAAPRILPRCARDTHTLLDQLAVLMIPHRLIPTYAPCCERCDPR
jgi:hypothetical protein